MSLLCYKGKSAQDLKKGTLQRNVILILGLHLGVIGAALASTEWAETYKLRVEKYIALYRNCGYSFDGDDVILSYLLTNHSCVGEHPMSLMYEGNELFLIAAGLLIVKAGSLR